MILVINIIMNIEISNIAYKTILYTDSNFSYILLDGTNIFYLHINNGEYSLKPTPLNKFNTIPNIDLQNNKIVNGENMLLEGIILNNIFYCADIHTYNNEIVNHNYFTRYSLLKSIIVGNSSFSIVPLITNSSLEDIIIDQKSFINKKYSHILIKKNNTSYVVECEVKLSILPVKNKPKTKEIKLSVDKPFSDNETYKILSTNKPEIYLVDHVTFYSVLRIRNIESSKTIKEVVKNKREIKLVYNSLFSKYEY